MPFSRCIVFGLWWLLPNCFWAQTGAYSGANRVDSILNVIQTDQSMDSEIKSNLAEEVFQLSLKGKDLCKQILSRVKQATYLDNMGMSDSALIQLYWASRFYQPTCDSMILMSLYANLTNVYLSLGETSRVDSVTKVLLTAWNPTWKNKDSRFAVLNNLGIAQATIGDVTVSTNTFHQAFREAKADANQRYIEKALINLGSIKGMTEDLDSAYFFFNTAAGNAKKNTDLDSYMSLLINLANVDMQRDRLKSAMATLDSAYALADTLKSTENLAYVQRSRADLYARLKNYKAAYEYLDDYILINKQFLDEERVKAVTEMMEKYESEKKARQIQQLELDKLDATLKTERIANARNRYLFVGIFFLLGAIGIYTRLQYVHKSRTAIQKEKNISEGLLLNILLI